ncbi:hypothetical protein IU409_17070 [Nocardia cyriacigeorgica]|uniref:hypothetical protein n=1 Tax=Nocardia cyriacigeorgica TaxID=135487 RepID=UPI00189375C2|nr:hypothetical protein [Nocardia cyriacigeorgica]MBF6345202.1 hypothetical protein [Nocardia cyriacigeorgica]
MEISHMTYAVVRQGVQIPPVELEPVHEVLRFLTDHVDGLLVKTRQSDAPPAAFFHDEGCQDYFHSLYSGTTEEFLFAYRALAQRLANAMNGTSKEGLLVGLRVNNAGPAGTVAGVLKLEIVTPNGAALQSNADGSRVRLEAVQDLLDRPGQLQKSAIVTSALATERVFCGDQLYTQSKYFPRSLGIQVHPRPRAALASMLEVARKVAPELGGVLAAAVRTCSAGGVKSVLAEAAKKVPELTAVRQEEIAARLGARAEPVLELDPTRAIKATYKIGDITVSGPASDVEQLISVCESPDGRWRVTIDSDSQPRLRYH